MTACVWIRGILSDEYNVPVASVTYLRGGEETPDDPKNNRVLPAAGNPPGKRFPKTRRFPR